MLAVAVVVFSLAGEVLPGSAGTPDLAIRSVEQIPQSAPALDVATAIRAYFVRFEGSDKGKIARREHAELTRLYTSSGHAPLWVDSLNRPTGQAEEALIVLGEADADGLDPSAYFCSELALWRSSLRSGPSPFRDVAAFDITLSAAMLRYFRHLHRGRVDPKTLGYRLTVPEDGHDFVAALHAAILSDRIRDTAIELTPSLAQYRGLRTMLARYRLLPSADDLGHVPPIAVLRPGDQHSGLAAIRQRLVTYGDLDTEVASAPSNLEGFAGAMVDAVKRFQLRHGLEPDGIIGVRTEAALRVPHRTRIRQIELALERLRWLPDVGDRRLIALNIPMFQLWAWDLILPDGSPSFRMRAIVGGALRTQTPVFMQDMRYVVFRPYWNVPVSIVEQEILPLLGSDPDYLKRQQMEIVRGAGDDAIPVPDKAENRALLRKGALRLRQRPGPHNSLGLVKFVFPNDGDVYMHGTPAQELFSRSRRDFSHGCVRVEDPVALATWVLQSEPRWNRERILQAMAGPTSQRVFLSRPIQVILFYSTAAFMPETGTVHFADDIYRHDLRLDRALAAQ